MRKSAPLLPSLLLPILLLGTSSATARTPYVEIQQRLSAEQLRQVGLSPEQLSLLNRMLREAEERAPAETAASEPADTGPAIGAGRPAAPARPGAGQFIGLDDGPIKSRLKHDVSGWEPGFVFELENGQQWKVLKGEMKLRKPLPMPEIVVVPGVAGRWFLQVDEDMPKARVYRID